MLKLFMCDLRKNGVRLGVYLDVLNSVYYLFIVYEYCGMYGVLRVIDLFSFFFI